MHCQRWKKGGPLDRQGGYDYTNLLVPAIVMYINLDFDSVPNIHSARTEPGSDAKTLPQTN